MASSVHWFLRERRRRQRLLGLLGDDGVETAPDYVEPVGDEPLMPPPGEPTEPTDTDLDPDTGEPEPGIDPDYAEPTRIELSDDKQTVIRTEADEGTWGNAYVATALTGPEYWEIEVANSTPIGATLALGVSTLDMPLNGVPGKLPGTIAYWSDGRVFQNDTVIATLATYGRGDRIGVSYAADGGVRFSKNCTWLNSGNAVGSVTGSPRFPFVGLYSANSRTAFRFSTSKFGCAVPEGFYPIGQVPVPPDVGVVHEVMDSYSLEGTSTSVSDVPFGDADAGRVIVVDIAWTATANTSISGVTIGGVTATRAVRQPDDVTTLTRVESWYATVPTGTSGTVSTSWSVNYNKSAAIVVRRLANLEQLTPRATANQTNNTPLPIAAIDGGVVLGAMALRNDTGGGVRFTTLDHEHSRVGTTTLLSATFASKPIVETGTFSVEHDGAATWRVIAAAWR
jgi:hypothetical protein